MTKSVISNGLLTDIADAIREKTGSTDSMTPAQMADAIAEIPAGGGATEPYIEYTVDNNGYLKGAHMYGFSVIPDSICRGLSYLQDVVIEGTPTKVGSAAFMSAGMNGIGTIKLPDTIQTIVGSAFNGCAIGMTALPSGLTYIGTYAFQDASYMTFSKIPDGVKTLDTFVFYGCKRLPSMDIPAGVTKINDRAFGGCTGLKQVRIYGQPTIHNNSFYDCTALTDIYVPWSEGAVSGAPWGATAATIHYDTQYDSNGDPVA